MMDMLILVLFVLFSIFLIMLPHVFEDNIQELYSMIRQRLPRRANLIELQNFLTRTLSYLIGEFKYLMQSDFRVWFLWIQGAILWILGCYSWLLQVEVSYAILTSLSVLFCMLAIFVRSTMIHTHILPTH